MEVDDDRLVVTSSVKIPRHELVVRFSTSGGPGGQHANKTATRAELVFDVEASGAFSDAQRDRVRRSSAPWSASSSTTSVRSSATGRSPRNASSNVSAMHSMSIVPVDRRVRPSGSQQRRIDGKKQRGETKRARQRPSIDDD